MLNNLFLNKTASGWEFQSEQVLEDFVWLNLENLLSLTGVKRQYSVNQQRCDILAVDHHKSLVIIELKNIEDRGIVQQLTRYYDGLCETKPFADLIDYQQPVKLVAIAPNFHRDSLIDIKYNKLFFELIYFSILHNDQGLFLQLQDVNHQILAQSQIPHQEREVDALPLPPKALEKMISQSSAEEREAILQLREKILRFDPKMEEISSGGTIKYGNGNNKSSKFCAEFCTDNQGNFLLFLWFPLKCGQSNRLGRAKIWTDWQGKALIEGYVTEGIGTKINREKRLMRSKIEKLQEMKECREKNGPYSPYIQKDFDYISYYCKNSNRIIKKIQSLQPVTYEELQLAGLDMAIFICIRNYFPYYVTDEHYQKLDSLVGIALEKWHQRI
jgi:RecB family endonuclease NucS